MKSERFSIQPDKKLKEPVLKIKGYLLAQGISKSNNQIASELMETGLKVLYPQFAG